MNIFTGDNKIIQKEIEELLKLIEETKTKSLPIYQTTETLIYFYELLTNRKTDYFRRLVKMDYPIIEKKEMVLENRKIDNIIATKGIHEELIAYLSTYFNREISFSSQEEFLENKVSKEKEMYEIIHDFFKSHNKNVSSVFDFLIKEKRIFKMPNKEELDKAYNLMSSYKDNFYIFVKDGGNIITTMTDIVHEMGHVMDDINILSSISRNRRKKCHYYMSKSLLIEVISTMYEKEFIDFLLEEGVYRDYTELEKETNFSNFIYSLEEVELLLCFPNHLLKRNQYKKVPKQDLMNYLEDNFSIIVDQDDMFHPKDIDLSSNLEYCYGFVLSTYFSYLKGHDYPRYQESFRKFLKLRADYFSPNFFESIGTTSQELVDIVREDCEEFSSKRIIKK